MSRGTDIKELGEIGEKVVQRVLTRFDIPCNMSDDPFDQDKDLVAFWDGHKYTVQVKTEAPFFEKNSFSIDASKSNQLPAVLSADLLIFVEVPSPGYPFIHLYQCINRSYANYTRRDGSKIHLFPIRMMNWFETITAPKLAAHMTSLAPVKWPKFLEEIDDEGKRKRTSTYGVHRATATESKRLSKPQLVDSSGNALPSWRGYNPRHDTPEAPEGTVPH